MLEASIRFSPDFMIESHQRYRRQHCTRYVEPAMRLLGLLSIPIAVWGFWQGYARVGIFAVGAGILMLFGHRMDHWLARRSFRKSPYCNEDVVIEFTPAGLRLHSPKRDASIDWSAFTKVTHFQDGFLLFQGPRLFNWIPLSSLSDRSEAVELESLLRLKIPQHKVVEQPLNRTHIRPCAG